jgi:uncharacterized membrane protein
LGRIASTYVPRYRFQKALVVGRDPQSLVRTLIVDRGLDFWPAMELSRHTVNPQWFGYFAFMLLLVLLNLAGVLLLGLGLLVTIPVSFCAVTAAYADLFGLQSKEY